MEHVNAIQGALILNRYDVFSYKCRKLISVSFNKKENFMVLNDLEVQR